MFSYYLYSLLFYLPQQAYVYVYVLVKLAPLVSGLMSRFIRDEG